MSASTDRLTAAVNAELSQRAELEAENQQLRDQLAAAGDVSAELEEAEAVMDAASARLEANDPAETPTDPETLEPTNPEDPVPPVDPFDPEPTEPTEPQPEPPADGEPQTEPIETPETPAEPTPIPDPNTTP